MTTPPTNSDIDTYVQGLINSQDPQWFLPTLAARPDKIGSAVSVWYVGYTQNDSTKVYEAISNPVGIASNDTQAFAHLNGLVSEYGSVNIREYTVTYSTATASGTAAGSTEQATVNNPSNWGTAL